jgi:hypothetical protein
MIRPTDKQIFYGIILLIVLLLAFNLKIYDMNTKFDKYCIVSYSENDTCPCVGTRGGSQPASPKNVTDGFLNLLPDIENLSVS